MKYRIKPGANIGYIDALYKIASTGFGMWSLTLDTWKRGDIVFEEEYCLNKPGKDPKKFPLLFKTQYGSQVAATMYMFKLTPSLVVFVWEDGVDELNEV